MTTTTIQKWGNSAAIRLPANYLKATGLAVGSQVSAEIQDGVIVLKAMKPKPRYSLRELLAQCSGDWSKDPNMAIWDQSPDLGNEIYDNEVQTR